MNYDAEYFVKKFEAIPEDKWCTGDFALNGACCAFGHCGVRRLGPAELGATWTKESEALGAILGDAFSHRITPIINDGHHQDYQQPTPKQRILAALRDVKATGKPIC